MSGIFETILQLSELTGKNALVLPRKISAICLGKYLESLWENWLYNGLLNEV